MSEEKALAHVPAQGGFVQMVQTLALNPDFDSSKLEKMLDIQLRVMDKQAQSAFTAAVAAASADIPQVQKGGVISLGRAADGTSKGSIPFARWEDMDKVIRPILSQNGLFLSFDTKEREGGGLVVIGKLTHRDGHSETAQISLALDAGPGRNNLQAMGSSLSYGKRYTAEMLLNIVRCDDDDDGVTGGVKLISAEQASEIERLIVETKSDAARFCHAFKVAHVTSLSTEDYTKAKNMLMAKAKKMEGGAA